MAPTTRNGSKCDPGLAKWTAGEATFVRTELESAQTYRNACTASAAPAPYIFEEDKSALDVLVESLTLSSPPSSAPSTSPPPATSIAPTSQTAPQRPSTPTTNTSLDSDASSPPVSGATASEQSAYLRAVDFDWCRQHLPGRVVERPDPADLMRHAGGESLSKRFTDAQGRFQASTDSKAIDAPKSTPHFVELQVGGKQKFPYTAGNQQWSDAEKEQVVVFNFVPSGDKSTEDDTMRDARTSPRWTSGGGTHWMNTLADCSADQRTKIDNTRVYLGSGGTYLRHGRRITIDRKPDVVLQAKTCPTSEKSTWAGAQVMIELSGTAITPSDLQCRTKNEGSKKVRQLVTNLRDKLLEDLELEFVWGIGVFGSTSYLFLMDRERLQLAPLGAITTSEGNCAFSATLSTLRSASTYELGGNPYLLYATVEEVDKSRSPPIFSNPPLPSPQSTLTDYIPHAVGDVVATHLAIIDNGLTSDRQTRLFRFTSGNTAPSPSTPFSRSTSVRYLDELDSSTLETATTDLLLKVTRSTTGRHGAEIAALHYCNRLNLSEQTRSCLPTLWYSYRAPRHIGSLTPLPNLDPAEGTRSIFAQASEFLLFQPVPAPLRLHKLSCPNDLRTVAIKLLDVVDDFFQNGCYHGDLSTSNILVTYQQQRPLLRLIDFETFRPFEASATSMERTGTRDVMPIDLLTPLPRQKKGRQPRYELETFSYLLIKAISQSYRPSVANQIQWRQVVATFGWDGAQSDVDVRAARHFIWGMAKDEGMDRMRKLFLGEGCSKIASFLVAVCGIQQLSSSFFVEEDYKEDKLGKERYSDALKKLQKALEAPWDQHWGGKM